LVVFRTGVLCVQLIHAEGFHTQEPVFQGEALGCGVRKPQRKANEMQKTGYVFWRPEFSVGVEKLDNQHKELLNLVNDSISCCTGNAETERIFFDKIIRIGLDYLENHFSTEEQIMIKGGYQHYHTHKTEHDNMIKNVTNMVNDIESGKTPLNLLQFALFLRDWFLNHISTFDKPAEDCFKDGYN
jgi:hemerythrin